jgi:magnesium transporter
VKSNIKNRLKKKKNKLSSKSGLPSESMIYVGEEREEKVSIKLLNYDSSVLEECELNKSETIDTYIQKDNVTWIIVNGIHDSNKVQDICNYYKIHPLIQEDILNTHQRTKIEEFDDYIFITFKHLYFSEQQQSIETEQISAILGHNWLLSFQETDSTLFDEIINRIQTSKGTIRQRNADFLLYKILDSAVDQYFVLIDKISDMVEDIEEETMYYPNNKTSFKIQGIKKELMVLSKHILPMREAMNKIETGGSDLIDKKIINYFKDVHDHTLQAYETIENHRSLLSDLMNIYFTTTSNKLNQVMKVLTIISTIFIPLSFLTGVFGMNFTHFPGIENPYAYYYFWSIVILIFIGMIVYFRRKQWF